MDTVTPEKRSEIMKAIKSRRTRPEMLVHNYLKGNQVMHKMWPDMDGHPDVLLNVEDKSAAPVVVFVNGCFWHGCPTHWRCPKTNSLFWSGKIDRNRRRQLQSARNLRAKGYKVVLLWEHDLTEERMEKIIARLMRAMRP